MSMVRVKFSKTQQIALYLYSFRRPERKNIVLEEYKTLYEKYGIKKAKERFWKLLILTSPVSSFKGITLSGLIYSLIPSSYGLFLLKNNELSYHAFLYILVALCGGLILLLGFNAKVRSLEEEDAFSDPV